MTAPLVSCLTVTLPIVERFDLLCGSIEQYRRQTHLDREMILVLNGGDPACARRIRAHVEGLGDASIRIFEPPGHLTLGALRNLSFGWAQGTVLCQWDDDDLYHPQRLAGQLAALERSGAEAVFLSEVMQFFTAERTLSCTSWLATELGAFPGSLMCLRSVEPRYPEAGAEAVLGEDLAFAKPLLERGRTHMIAGMPHWYVYVTHGRNSWPEEHHQMLRRELSLSRGRLARQETALREGLKDIDFGPGEVTVQGFNGTVFTLPGARPLSACPAPA